MQPNRTRLVQRVVTLAAGVSTEIAPAAIGRNYLGIMNIGTGDASLAFSATAVAGQGWLVASGGGGMTFTNAEGVPSNQVTAISTAGTTIVILEG